jgi:hypothetical protein
VAFAPNISSSSGFNGPREFSGLRPGLLVQLAIVFLVSYFVLFFGMARRPGMYDEGIMLTGAMRVADV